MDKDIQIEEISEIIDAFCKKNPQDFADRIEREVFEAYVNGRKISDEFLENLADEIKELHPFYFYTLKNFNPSDKEQFLYRFIAGGLGYYIFYSNFGEGNICNLHESLQNIISKYWEMLEHCIIAAFPALKEGGLLKFKEDYTSCCLNKINPDTFSVFLDLVSSNRLLYDIASELMRCGTCYYEGMRALVLLENMRNLQFEPLITDPNIDSDMLIKYLIIYISLQNKSDKLFNHFPAYKSLLPKIHTLKDALLEEINVLAANNYIICRCSYCGRVIVRSRKRYEKFGWHALCVDYCKDSYRDNYDYYKSELKEYIKYAEETYRNNKLIKIYLKVLADLLETGNILKENSDSIITYYYNRMIPFLNMNNVKLDVKLKLIKIIIKKGKISYPIVNYLIRKVGLDIEKNLRSFFKNFISYYSHEICQARLFYIKKIEDEGEEPKTKLFDALLNFKKIFRLYNTVHPNKILAYIILLLNSRLISYNSGYSEIKKVLSGKVDIKEFVEKCNSNEVKDVFKEFEKQRTFFDS